MSALDRYLEYTEHTESPTQFHRWCFISGVGAALGRRVWLPFGHNKVFPNSYCLIVGTPAVRKTSAINITQSLMERGQFNKFCYNRTSREKFLLDFEEGFDVRRPDGKIDMGKLLDKPLVDVPSEPPETEVYVNCGEFIDFIGRNPTNFIDLLTTLWDNLPIYQERLKNSKSVSIIRPTISVMGAITPATLAEALPPSVIGQGFMSRVVMVFSHPRRIKIAWPSPPDEVMAKELGDFFFSLQSLRGEVKLTSEAKDTLELIYENWPNLNDVRLQYYCGRRHQHLLKLCIVLAAVHGTLVITADTVIEANTILTWTEKDMHLALGEFGESRHAKATQKVMESLALASQPQDFNAIWKTVSMDLDRRTQLQEIIQNLVLAEKIELMPMDNKQYVVLKRNTGKKKQAIGVDFARYIREFGREQKADYLTLEVDEDE